MAVQKETFSDRVEVGRALVFLAAAMKPFQSTKALGELDAARLFVRHAGQAVWRPAGATMITSPFIHHMTLAVPGVPEALEVRIRGIIGNGEIGEFSDIVSVTLTQGARILGSTSRGFESGGRSFFARREISRYADCIKNARALHPRHAATLGYSRRRFALQR